MRLSVERITALQRALDEELTSLVLDHGLNAAARKGLQLASEEARPGDELQTLRRFLVVVWLFEHASNTSELAGKTLDDLSKIGAYALRLMGVRPYNSKLSYLHGVYFRARAKALGHQGEPWLATWSLCLADATVSGLSSVSLPAGYPEEVLKAELNLQAGSISDSLEGFRRAEELASDEISIAAARLGMVRCLRLLGEVQTAWGITRSTLQMFSLSESTKESLEWERAMLAAQKTDELSPLTERIKSSSGQGSELSDPHYLLKAVLWCHATKQRATLANLPSSAWFRRRYRLSTYPDAVGEALDFLTHLEDCYDTGADASRDDIYAKLKVVGDHVASLHRRTPTEDQALYLAGLVRWLIRAKQRPAAALVLGEFKRCSHLLSEARTGFLYGLLSDLGDRLHASAESVREDRAHTSLRAGTDRSLKHFELFAKVCLTAMALKTGRWFRTKSEDEIGRDLIIRLSQLLKDYAGASMKGPIHKVSQALLTLAPLPPEAEQNFREVLWGQHAFATKEIRKVIEDEFRQPIDTLFAEFSPEPTGIGSVSQVHRARLHGGQEVAVKVQFPELDRVAAQDLRFIGRIFSIMRWVLPRFDLTGVRRLIHDVVEQELDFRNERRFHEIFQTAANNGSGRWRVPQLYPELCGRRVMTMEYIGGDTIYQFAGRASDEERLRVAQALHDFTTRCPMEIGVLPLDFHPANMIIRSGQVFLIDFGYCIAPTSHYLALYQSIITNWSTDREHRVVVIEAAMRRAGILVDVPGVAPGAITDLVDVMDRQLDWHLCSEPGLLQRFNSLMFRHGVNQCLGNKDPMFFVAYTALVQSVRTISRLGVHQPEGWVQLVVQEIQERAQRQRQTRESQSA